MYCVLPSVIGMRMPHEWHARTVLLDRCLRAVPLPHAQLPTEAHMAFGNGTAVDGGVCLLTYKHHKHTSLLPSFRIRKFGENSVVKPLFLSFLFEDRVSPCPLAVLEFLYLPGWPQNQRSSCLCLSSAYYHTQHTLSY